MKCPVCHTDLPSPKGLCPGHLPGAFGLTALSPGHCRSTPEQRTEVDARRAEMARKELERMRDSRGAKSNTEVETD